MFSEIIKLVRNDRKLQWLLLLGLGVQLITCWTAIGYSSFDQHFSVIEFSSRQLGNPYTVGHIWEMEHFVRPTVQVYMFSGFYLVCESLSIHDPYTQMTILRFILGLVMFGLFNLMALYYFRSEKRKKILYVVLLLLNFSWILPFTRVQFSSEMMSSLFLFGALFWYDTRKDKQKGLLKLAIIGFLLSLAFYFRFQAVFALAGFGIWILFIGKKYKHILPLALGFMAGIALNLYMDHEYYKEWVVTPFTYYMANFTDGRLDSFGRSSFLKYIGMLIAVLPAPFFSIVLLYYSLKIFLKKYREIIFIPVLLFIIGHSVVGHKEERFLYPILNVMPVILGWGFVALLAYYEKCKQWIRNFLNTILVITIVINGLLLLLISTTPYCQTVEFGHRIKNKFKNKETVIYCLQGTPFETESAIPMVFYQKGIGNLDFRRISQNDSIRPLSGSGLWLATTFNRAEKDFKLIDSLGYKPVMYSSRVLWEINEWLHSKKMATINDIWVLYKKE